MSRFLLDTDHVTLSELGHPVVVNHIALQLPGEVGISAVSVYESIRGRMAEVARYRSGTKLIAAFDQLVKTVQFFKGFPVIPFDATCEHRLQQLTQLRSRVGTQDLRIAAVALVNNLILVTRNRRDFSRVPGLQIVDWSV
jgi:tRNA(fMet)-specific endonuclease VapC